MDESTDFVLLGCSATTSPHCTFETRSILREKKDFWTNLRIFSYSVRLPPPSDLTLAVSRACRMDFFGYYPKSPDFSEFRLGNPVNTIGGAGYMDQRRVLLKVALKYFISVTRALASKLDPHSLQIFAIQKT